MDQRSSTRTAERLLRVVGQVFPWDLAYAPERAHVWAEAGIDEVSIPAHYHSVRAIARGSSGIRHVIQQSRSAYYLSPSDSIWSGSEILPARPDGLPADLFLRSLTAASDAGLASRALIALTHVDRTDGPSSFCTVDAWGNRSTIGLCASWGQVVEFGRNLVVDVVRQTGVTRMHLEAVAGLGFRHLVAHDKTPMAWVDERAELLLSLCFCEACGDVLRTAGRDVERDRMMVRAAISDPGLHVDEIVAAMLQARAERAARVSTELAADVDGHRLDVMVAATTDRSAFGSFAPLQAAPAGISSLCTEVGTRQGWSDIESWRTATEPFEIGGTVTLLPGHPSARQLIDRLRGGDAVPDILTLYHLGSAPDDALDRLGLAELLLPSPTASRSKGTP